MNRRLGAAEFAQASATKMQTFRVQHVPTAHAYPTWQSVVTVQSARPAHGVWPSAHIPAPPVIEAHTQDPPGPHALKVSQV
jgi:hypothetical protein